ncbi:MAG: phosphoribosylamine--glycine ligase [Bacteroidota bacterium]
MNVLIIGSGGREHALGWKIVQSDKCDKLYVAPGNAGTAAIGENLNIKVNEFEAIASAINEYHIKMVVIGPEDPLVNGLSDFLSQQPGFEDLMIIGPNAAGAQLEGSKDFSKTFMEENNIPTASFRTFEKNDLEEAYAYIDTQQTPIVVKADGLAAGKGVIIAQTKEDAKAAVKSMLIDNQFAEAGHRVLIEQHLNGIELSVFVLSDGVNYKILPEAKDYKRIGEKDTGLNTGGMGAISPVIFATDEFLSKVDKKVIQPTLSGLNNSGIRYVGFIFIGLMNIDGEPYVIEYNVRMGDPETQVVIPRIENDLLELLEATASGTLDKIELKLDKNTASTVVGVAGGYPQAYAKGDLIKGLDKTVAATVFHAGTKSDKGNVVTNGGRVIAVTGKGASLKDALNNSYSTLEQINWDNMYYRKDIGQDLLALNQ